MEFLKYILLFFAWVMDHFHLPGIFTPFCRVYKIITHDPVKGVGVGVADYYVFGLRVARFSKTIPWQKLN